MQRLVITLSHLTCADFRGETYGTTFADYYPTGYNGLTLASLGTFSSGSAVTHDPKTAGFTPGAMGSISAGTLNPEAYGFTFNGVTAGTTLVGYTVENIDQLVMIRVLTLPRQIIGIFTDIQKSY